MAATTPRGARAEARVRRLLTRAGYTVRAATPREDARGVDLWVQGHSSRWVPVQVKCRVSDRQRRRTEGRCRWVAAGPHVPDLEVLSQVRAVINGSPIPPKEKTKLW